MIGCCGLFRLKKWHQLKKIEGRIEHFHEFHSNQALNVLRHSIKKLRRYTGVISIFSKIRIGTKQWRTMGGGPIRESPPPLRPKCIIKYYILWDKLRKLITYLLNFHFKVGQIRVEINFSGASGAILRKKNSQKFRACGALFHPWDEFQIYLVFRPPFGNF